MMVRGLSIYTGYGLTPMCMVVMLDKATGFIWGKSIELPMM